MPAGKASSIARQTFDRIVAMSSARIFAMVTFAPVVLLIAAEFGANALDRMPAAETRRGVRFR